MKSSIIPDTFFVECGCGSLNHLLGFYYNDETNDVDIFCTESIDDISLFGRIKIAIKYIFKPERFNLSTTVILNEKNIKDFNEVTNFMNDKFLLKKAFGSLSKEVD